MDFEFHETAAFAAARAKLLPLEDFYDLQDFLAEAPTKGDMIKGSGGCRKIRVGIEGRGKRGGGRVIYYYPFRGSVILFVEIFSKLVKEDLTPRQIEKLAEVVEAYKKGTLKVGDKNLLNAPARKKNPAKQRARYTGDESGFISGKVYLVEPAGRKVFVRSESGEACLLPAADFEVVAAASDVRRAA